MRHCPECGRGFTDDQPHCPFDEVPLLADDPLLGLIVAEKYRIEAMIGQGGMGSVYRATQLGLDRQVALKVLRPEAMGGTRALARFHREAKAVARLSHPHIITVFDYGNAPQVGAYLAMDLLEGRTLREALQQGGPLPLAEALRYMRQTCSAVHAAHTAGIVHRDLKPENIMLVGGAGATNVKVLDFGLSKFLEQVDGMGASLTGASELLGTPLYMAPEQAEGSVLNVRTDVYALGCVFYEMLTGRPPFKAPSTIGLLLKHTTEMPVPPSERRPGLPRALDEAVLRALAKEPMDRYSSAAELARALPNAEEVAEAATTTLVRDPDTKLDLAESLRLTNLPVRLTRFVGRTALVVEVAKLLAKGPVITLHGAAGLGKTRLAIEVATEALALFRSGARWVDLATVEREDLVMQTIAQVLELSDAPGVSIEDSVLDALRTRQMLLVIDNAEHLLREVARVVSMLVSACPDLRVLVTSREPLAIDCEQLWEVPPLELPDLSRPESILECESVQLFLDRVRHFGGQVDAAKSTMLLGEVCRRLDGIPLALELAAARTPVLSLEQIRDRLADQFRLLGHRTTVPGARHTTLRATVEWSYGMLAPDEARFLRRLAVFAGGWTLEAAEDVCAGGELATEDILDLLAALRGKSLILVEQVRRTHRYRMLTIIREFVLSEDDGDLDSVRPRHFAWFAALASRGATGLAGDEPTGWLEQMGREIENLRAAFEWGLNHCCEEATVMAYQLSQFFLLRGRLDEGRSWFARCLESDTGPAARGLALVGRGLVHEALGDLEASAQAHLAALDHLRGSGQSAELAHALYRLGQVQARLGAFSEAEKSLGESLAVSTATGDEVGIANVHFGLGYLANARGDWGKAREQYAESLSMYRRLGRRQRVATALHNVASAALSMGEADAAESALLESLTISESIGYTQLAAYTRGTLADVAEARGDLRRALTLYCAPLRQLADLGDRIGVAYNLEGFVLVAARLGLERPAARVAGAVSSLRDTLGSQLTEEEAQKLEGTLVAAFGESGEAELRRLLAEGRGLTARQAVAIALEAARSSNGNNDGFEA